MNIAQAAKLLLKGKQVRRAAWYGKTAIFHDRNAIDGNVCGFRAHDGGLSLHIGTASSMTWHLDLQDLLALDWEETE